MERTTSWIYEGSRYPMPPGARMHETWVSFGANDRVTDIVPRVGVRPKMRTPRGDVKPGMTMQHVRRLAGEPDRLWPGRGYRSWYYDLWNRTQFTVQFDKTGIVLARGPVSFE
jgi:hypothetical protein